MRAIEVPRPGDTQEDSSGRTTASSLATPREIPPAPPHLSPIRLPLLSLQFLPTLVSRPCPIQSRPLTPPPLLNPPHRPAPLPTKKNPKFSCACYHPVCLTPPSQNRVRQLRPPHGHHERHIPLVAKWCCLLSFSTNTKTSPTALGSPRNKIRHCSTLHSAHRGIPLDDTAATRLATGTTAERTPKVV